jgi:protein-tyrosine-phosphatase
MKARRILFISTTGSARAQIAVALLAHLGGNGFAPFGATADPPDPLASRTLAELGIATANTVVMPLADFTGQSFDVAVTLCDGDATV